MPRKCFVPGCKTGYMKEEKIRKKEGRRRLSLFTAPGDETLLKKWKIAILRADRDLRSHKDCVCELHFPQKDILRYYKHTMGNGSEVFIKRDKVCLRPGTVPSIFPNLPTYLNRNKEKKKSPKSITKKTKRKKMQSENINYSNEINFDEARNKVKKKSPKSTSEKTKIKKPQPENIKSVDETNFADDSNFVDETNFDYDDDNFVDETNFDDVDSNIVDETNFDDDDSNIVNETNLDDENNFAKENNLVDETEPQFTFNDLLVKLSEIYKPNKLWAVSSHEDFIICVKWNSDFFPERQIIIDANLSIKIMYCGFEVPSMSNAVIESVESLSLIMKEVDRYFVCPGAINGDKNCTILMEFGGKLPDGTENKCSGCKSNTSKLSKVALKNKE